MALVQGHPKWEQFKRVELWKNDHLSTLIVRLTHEVVEVRVVFAIAFRCAKLPGDGGDSDFQGVHSKIAAAFLDSSSSM